MKRILFLSVIFLASCFCYGQRLNVKGQKMIKRIERVTENEKEVTGIIDFNYDKCNKLCGLVIKQKYNGSTVFIKNGNTMTRAEQHFGRLQHKIDIGFMAQIVQVVAADHPLGILTLKAVRIASADFVDAFANVKHHRQFSSYGVKNSMIHRVPHLLRPHGAPSL